MLSSVPFLFSSVPFELSSVPSQSLQIFWAFSSVSVPPVQFSPFWVQFSPFQFSPSGFLRPFSSVSVPPVQSQSFSVQSQSLSVQSQPLSVQSQSLSVQSHSAASGPQIPQKIQARFARRIASFPYVLLLFFTINTPKNPGALRAPDCFISLWVLLLSDHNYPQKSPARFARRIVSIPYGYNIFLSQIPQKCPARFARRPSYGFPIESL